MSFDSSMLRFLQNTALNGFLNPKLHAYSFLMIVLGLKLGLVPADKKVGFKEFLKIPPQYFTFFGLDLFFPFLDSPVCTQMVSGLINLTDDVSHIVEVPCLEIDVVQYR